MTKEEKILEDISNLLDKYHIKHCLMFGTLLGVYRDNKIIETNDVDIGIFEQFWKFDSVTWRHFNIDLRNIGYRVRDASYNYICIDDYTDCHVDIYFLIRRLDGYYIKVTGIIAKFPFEDFDCLIQKEFNGKKYLIPADIEGHLKRNYGDDWKTPQTSVENWNSRTPIDNYEKIKYTYIVSVEKNYNGEEF